MKYYSIGITEDLNLIGSYPQIEKEDDYNLSLSNSYWNVTWERSPDFIPNYKIRINDKAKITNLLSNLSGFYGLTVDENLKNLLLKFNLPQHQFYPINVRYLNKYLNYFWFHFINSLLNYVDFQNSIFELFKKSPYKILEELVFSSLIELQNKVKGLGFEYSIRLKNLKLNDNFPQYDVISLWGITPLILVSENLKMELEKSDLNGFVFNEYKPLICSRIIH